ncbi:WD40 repeat-like protein [Auriscalpium vulgare]|uniref:WD40 repeat-like protein n=1 Tax=Auriscalpium vulgare TaxID=40419 RepID=A0ACB8RUC1_9AGAM|nr:WD40 repeat-like protein [Auriscalpium vulgare]
MTLDLDLAGASGSAVYEPMEIVPAESSTIYMPIVRPPTPAPSPSPTLPNMLSSTSLALSLTSTSRPQITDSEFPPFDNTLQDFAALKPLGSRARKAYLSAILAACSPQELHFLASTIGPLLKRDFLRTLPTELALHVLSFVDEPSTLTRVSQVSRTWHALVQDEWLWRRLAHIRGYDLQMHSKRTFDLEEFDAMGVWYTASGRNTRARMLAEAGRAADGSLLGTPRAVLPDNSYASFFKHAYITTTNWRRNGTLLRAHRIPVLNPESGVVTSVALDGDWLVAGLANHRIHIFSTHTGVLVRTLIGHELGVWAVNLVSRGGAFDPTHFDHPYEPRSPDDVPEVRTGIDGMLRHNRAPAGSQRFEPKGLDHLLPPSMRVSLGLDQPRTYLEPDEMDDPAESEARRTRIKQSDVCGASYGWGQPSALVVSGGCDKVLRVWDIRTGFTIYVLQGHTSTVRCLKVLHNRPIAVSGSRDATLRVWDIQRGRMLRVLRGHSSSVRALDVSGNRVVSGSYDTTCRLWDIDTGECLHVLRGHYNQIYSVAFDGNIIASGGLDTTVRVWDATSGQCNAMLQGHAALVCQLQISPTMLATGGADGRVVTFSLPDLNVRARIAAHDSSVTSMQFDGEFLVTSGNDGRVRLFEAATGNYVRELSEQSETVWKVAFRREGCAVMCRRLGKTAVELWSFRPRETVAITES